MNGLVKRMCILKQLKTGFSADGNPLSGVVRVERYGKLSAVQLSLINFAPLSQGKYVCVLCDKQGERLIFTLLPDKTDYRTENSAFDPEKGFCALVCFVKTDAVCIAAGQYGSGGYNLKLLLNGLTAAEKRENAQEPKGFDPPPMPEKEIVFVRGEGEGFPVKLPAGKTPEPAPMPAPPKYDDEAVSEENYYAEGEHATGDTAADTQNENAFAAGETPPADGRAAADDGAPEDVRRPFRIAEGQTYFLKIKEELEELFAAGERTDALQAALPGSEWVRVADAGGCLVGVVYEDALVKYIAYALPAGAEQTPPAELEGACFLPEDPLSPEKGGYFVLFQDAGTGEVVRVKSA